MISKLKKRFILLAMVSLTVLLSVIVAGMNIINYRTVVHEADETLETLSENRGRLPVIFGDGLDDMLDELYGDDYDDLLDDLHDDDEIFVPGGPGDPGAGMDPSRGGTAPSGMTRDEAEETRFFSVLVDSSGNVVMVNTDRIFAVDADDAGEYAEDVIKSGRSSGFIDEYRYKVSDEDAYTRITFLDCGRMLDAFRDFLTASVVMSLIGLIAVFLIIVYFAGRIVRPVAESYEKQKRFITDAGHEIRTPLTIIKANIDVMKMDIEDAEAAEAGSGSSQGAVPELARSITESLDDINGQVDRLASLTDDLVYLSRMEEGGSTLTMTEVPVSDIVTETAGAFAPVAAERNKGLDIEVTPMLSMQGSTKELEKLVSILTENALKYSPEGDRIKVSLRKDGRNILLEVKNRTAEAVSDEDLAHAFDRFYRADKSRNSAAGGHGIGLSMASAIVAAHGGKIRARSGDGYEFIVTAAMPAN